MEDQSPPVEPDQTSSSDEVSEQETFPASYVRELRDENAARRVEAKEAKEAQMAALKAAVELAVERHATALKEPADLMLYIEEDTILGEDGLPSPEKIKEAVLALLEERPHLDARKPEGDIDQGRRGEPPKVFDLSRMLRDAAG